MDEDAAKAADFGVYADHQSLSDGRREGPILAVGELKQGC